jgi:hypothetical protein
MTQQIFGAWSEPDGQHQEYLELCFSPSSVPLQQRWRNNGLSADFLAGYVSTFFQGEDSDGMALNRQTDISGAVSFIANELLENAMKFSYAPARRSVNMTMQLEPNWICFYISNSVAPAALAAFQGFIQRLLTEDPARLHMQQILNAENDPGSVSVSGLGYLTMLNDYGAQLAWKFETPAADESAVPQVTTLVRLPV